MWKTLRNPILFPIIHSFINNINPELFVQKITFFGGDKKLCLQGNRCYFDVKFPKKLEVLQPGFHKTGIPPKG